MEPFPNLDEARARDTTVEPGNSYEKDLSRILQRTLDKVTLGKIQNADFEYVHGIAHDLSKEARAKQGSVMEARVKKFYRRNGANLVKLADSSKKFLNSFQNINNIATGVDQQLGPLIYGLVAVVVTLGSNKQLQDDLIAEMLFKFDRWLSRLPEILRLEENNQKLTNQVIEIYAPIIDLLRETVHYYIQSTWRRVVQALTKPPTEYLQQRLSKVTESVADLMHELTVIQLADLKQLHKKKDLEEGDSHLASMKHVSQSFGQLIEGSFIEKMQRDCKSLYDMRLKFPRTCHSRSRPRPCILESATLEMLSHRQIFKDWEENPSSCLLLLGGNNFRRYAPQQECWLAPIASEFSSVLRSDSNNRVAFCSLIALDHIHQSAPLEQLALKIIILQLLEQDKSLCRQCSAPVSRQYSLARGIGDSGALTVMHLDPSSNFRDPQTDTLFDILSDVLSSIQGLVTVYIVLDGVEKLGETCLTDLFRSFFSVLSWLESTKSNVVVKIVALCFPQRWPCLKQSQSLSWELKGDLGLHGQAQSMKRVFHDLEWTQNVQVR